jgi:(S)-2-hydroxyglutarate dehydrogenase
MYQGKNIAVIGGGLIGLATAYKLSLEGAQVSLFEKEKSVGQHQSGNNSGVLHCGLYYQPGSLKAKLAVEGIQMMVDFCKTYNIPHDICGKAVVATNSAEIKALEKLAERGKANGLEGLRYLSSEELKQREPNVQAEKALLVPQEGIVDYSAVMLKLSSLIKEQRGTIYKGTPLQKVEETPEDIRITIQEQELRFDHLFACAGLQSDRVYQEFTGKKSPIRIVPFRGEYLKFKSKYTDLVNHLIYPVPDAKYPFLGVHFTRMIDGSREVGPNAVFAFKREGYRKGSFSLKDTLESLSYVGLQRFLLKNFSFAFQEFRSSLFLKNFVKKAQQIIPAVQSHMLESGPAGVRAQAVSPQGELIMDFNIEKTKRQTHVLNAPSPGATAALSIADYIIKTNL